MEFSSFFNDYKFGLKKINREVFSWKRWHFFHKLLFSFSIFILILLLGLICFFIMNPGLSIRILSIAYIFAVICLISLFSSISNPTFKRYMNVHFDKIHFSKRKLLIIELFTQYKIPLDNISSIDILIQETERQKMKYSSYNFKIKLSFIGAMLSAITPYIILLDNNTNINIFPLIIFVFTIIIVFISIRFIQQILSPILYPDTSKYDDLIDILYQLKLFPVNRKSVILEKESLLIE